MVGEGGERGTGGVPARHPSGVVVSAEVRQALASGQAVVALESSVLAQGLPEPANREASDRMEMVIRLRGATPAVSAVIAGETRLGLNSGAYEILLCRDNVAKISARDLPATVVGGGHGATTVAATLVIARAVGVPVFATGGIGGVHRDAPFDESADLLELSRSPIIVVCAGAKSILDLTATYERLESLGVGVVGFGTDEAPGFFTRGSGVPVPARADSPAEVVELYRAARGLGLPGALLVLNPPPEEAALPAEVVSRAVDEALDAARAAGIRGAAVTPYLLAAVDRATDGASLGVNLALLEGNAALAAEIAVALARGS